MKFLSNSDPKTLPTVSFVEVHKCKYEEIHLLRLSLQKDVRCNTNNKLRMRS